MRQIKNGGLSVKGADAAGAQRVRVGDHQRASAAVGDAATEGVGVGQRPCAGTRFDDGEGRTRHAVRDHAGDFARARRLRSLQGQLLDSGGRRTDLACEGQQVGAGLVDRRAAGGSREFQIAVGLVAVADIGQDGVGGVGAELDGAVGDRLRGAERTGGRPDVCEGVDA